MFRIETARPPRILWVLIFAAAAVIAAAAASLWHSTHLQPLGAAFAAATAVIGLLPAALFLSARQRPPFPLIALTGFFYALFYGIAPLFADYAWPPPMPVVIYALPEFAFFSTEAAGWAFAGLILLLSGFWAGEAVLWRRLPSVSLPRSYEPSRLRILAWLALAAHLVYLTVPAVKALPSIGQLLDPLGYFAYGIFFVLYLEDRLPLPEAILAGVTLIAEVLLLYMSTFVTPVVFLVIFLGAIKVRMSGRIPWLGAGVLLILVVIGYNMASSTRLSLRHAGDATRFQVLVETGHRYLVGAHQPFRNSPTAANSVAEQLSPLFRRANLLVPLTVVVEKTPASVEYWGGRTYLNLLTSYIPRALWPGKPTEQVGNEFGRRYGIIEQSRLDMSVNLPWLVEFYANFGGTGLILGMFSVGLLLALLNRLFNSPAMTPIEGVLGATVIFKLFYQESNLSVMTGSLLPLALALWAYLRVGLTLPIGSSRRS